MNPIAFLLDDLPAYLSNLWRTLMADDTPVTDSPAPDAPVADVAPPAPPRPLDQISADVTAAKARHAAAVTELQTSGGVLEALAQEYRAAITWFDQECQTVEADVEGAVSSAKSWLDTVLAKL